LLRLRKPRASRDGMLVRRASIRASRVTQASVEEHQSRAALVERVGCEPRGNPERHVVFTGDLVRRSMVGKELDKAARGASGLWSLISVMTSASRRIARRCWPERHSHASTFQFRADPAHVPLLCPTTGLIRLAASASPG